MVAALHSGRGASRQLLLSALNGEFELLLSVPLILEYQSVLTRSERLDNGILRLLPLRELGGKIVSLVRQESRYEYLLQKGPDREYRRPVHGDNFEDSSTNGFDECLPTVAKCLYPEKPFLGNALPDHGDV
jgi:hypothetical protein